MKYSESDLLATEKVIKDIINCAYRVRSELFCGYLESVYRNALLIELKESGLKAEPEVPIFVKYKNNIVGEFKADIIVEGSVIVELKSVQSLNTAHATQLVNYLTATGINHGLLINFGADKLEIKRKYRVYNATIR